MIPRKREIAGKPLSSLELPIYPNLLSLVLMMGMQAFQIELDIYTLGEAHHQESNIIKLHSHLFN